MFLNVRSLSFAYTPPNQILSEIDFDVAMGESLAIVGVSGCGKSTLMRILSGILPTSNSQLLTGTVNYQGEKPLQYRCRGRMSFMFQEPALLPHMTVAQNIGLPFMISGVDRNHEIAQLIESVGLTKFAKAKPRELSGGMRTRVALARSFLTDPELLFLDEAFASLDVGWKLRLYSELRQLRSQHGTTMIMVTHDIQEAILLSDRVLLLNGHGKISEEFNTRDSSSHGQIAKQIEKLILNEQNASDG